ncbi:phosphate ABC transporter substrate-binding protein [Sphingomonas metalli]|uniref:Phosphate ABC transporter substrate-binding protein n=1 Tax=Sphingomonas metalli TaxID=1779358 RepID=A0A916WQ48_9SPHN|nr:PhnD/SsuA/transferrin family substrate-binding protein [Sphingomonas metalli]GGB19176.1 phosphate ABC transporter substrate-binding protein [Sphingomonas metalli]
MTLPVASLPMYDHPAQAGANDALWRAIAERLEARGVRRVPHRLTRTAAPGRLWRDPALLFGQACGYPLVTEHLPLRVLALPVYAARGSEGGRHRSLIVTRACEGGETLAAFRGRRAAINDPGSNTGMNLFRAAVAPLAPGGRFFAEVIVTGAHRDSIRAVLRGEADVAAIDAVTYAGIERFEPALTEGLRIVDQTPSSPTLPFVTSTCTPIETVSALRMALADAMDDPALAEARGTLALTGLAAAEAGSFDGLSGLARQADRVGYPILA